MLILILIVALLLVVFSDTHTVFAQSSRTWMQFGSSNIGLIAATLLSALVGGGYKYNKMQNKKGRNTANAASPYRAAPLPAESQGFDWDGKQLQPPTETDRPTNTNWGFKLPTLSKIIGVSNPVRPKAQFHVPGRPNVDATPIFRRPTTQSENVLDQQMGARPRNFM